jgi:transposase, IS4 family protein
LQALRRHERREFKALPERWIAARTFAWLSRSGRLSKIYGITMASAEAFVKIACIRHDQAPDLTLKAGSEIRGN